MSKDTAPPPRNALVTGAANRIGATIARRLAEAGYGVAIHYRASAEPARALVAEIEAAGGRAAIVRADLESRAERGHLVAEAATRVGPLTVLVNNASVFEPDTVADLDPALWDTHFAIHAEAPVFLARDFAAQLPKGVSGNIINMIDERVLHLSPDFFSYTLSKSTLWAATRTLAQTLAPQIRVNAIGPGPTLKNTHQSQADFERSVARLPLRQGATPNDIAEGVLYILAARAMTGQMLALDGGEHLEWAERNGPTPRK
ncbi:SDR family oxidoreductase [Arsenicitalea aurantiaca]|uniref:SDR family oxidoreductase n=1 Tax=Arsenicitalea aurantiaca TaxID=1783274 RepID=A0A433XLW6_9HYPH|nr:SDR family oxidoreductase [Arsenicitalea aurantiaca]RUT34978.1 SDR family oxidoreductase [Arsenicitalea aurantiaca]